MLKYIGLGSFRDGVPARDLNDEEVKLFGERWLLATGLYKKEAKINKTKSEVKEDGNNTIKKSTNW